MCVVLTSVSVNANRAAAECNWLDTSEGVNKLGLEKIWFTDDLNQAVFLRAQRKVQLTQITQFLNEQAVQIDTKMSHLKDTLYFYNMNKAEVQIWLKKNLAGNNSSVWISILIPKVYAQSPNCAFNSSNVGIDTNQGQSFFQKFSSIVNGDFVKKIVGCSTQDPVIDEKENQSLSVENFSSTIMNHWEQLKEIITQLPNMPLPEDVKHELICDGLSVGIFVAQGAALSLTGAGAVVAVPRLFLALKRLMNTAKYLAGKIKVPTKTLQPVKTSAVASSATLAARLENVYGTQKKFITNMQVAQKQIINKGGRLTSSGRGNSNYDELYDWAKAEVGVQKDLLKTLDSLEKIKDRAGLTRQLSIQAERVGAEKRIQTLSKAFKF